MSKISPHLKLFLLSLCLIVPAIHGQHGSSSSSSEESGEEEPCFFEFFEDFFKKVFPKPPPSTPMPPTTSSTQKAPNVPVETRTINQIYRAALAEGKSPLVVYSGGTSQAFGDQTKQAFEQRFPNLTVDVVVDYSVYHGPRINVQLANGSLIPDVAMLQTVMDYPEWKAQGHLLQYKPANWSRVHSEYRDPDGFYTGTFMVVLGTLVNTQNLSRNQWPRTARDLLRPEFAGGKIVAVHPNSDDAELFLFKQYVDKYGFDFLTKFAAQKPLYVCGDLEGLQLQTLTAGGNVSAAIGGIAAIPFGNTSAVQFPHPAPTDPMTIATLYAAIFKQTKKPETAKLYLNWLLERENPNLSGTIWTVREDVPPLQGFPPAWQMPNSNHTAFLNFMQNYEGRERFRKDIDLFLGATTCAQSPLRQGINVQ